MRLTLFSRLIVGHLAVFIVVAVVAVYAIVQLHRFNDASQLLLDSENRVLDYEKKLADALLSQIRYERKFIIAKDETLYKQFLLFQKDFNRYLDEASSLVDSKAGRFLRNAKTYYRQYQELFDREVRYLRESQNYPQAEYKQEKETAADGILQELEELRSYTQQKMYGKIKELAEAGDNARRVAMLMGAASLILVVMLSLFITRSITQPISILKSKTSEIAKGNFDGTLNLSSPPEIAELAAAFNLMCQRLNEVDTMKSEFFSSMSHELRTPLASIREGTGLLLDGLAGPITDKQKRILSIIVEESHRLIGLVNSLLDLSKMEAGMMTYTFEKSSLTPLIDGVMTGIEPLARAKRISLYTELGEDLPSLRLDSEKVLQVLRNLLGNAVKFTPEDGHVRISAHNVDRGVRVSVADTGPGIPKENLTTVFNKFEQVRHTGTSPANGTGLGLAIAKHVVTAHGGKIWAESEPGQGSTFVFILPV